MDYDQNTFLKDMIAEESKKIAFTHSCKHESLAELYTRRGESNLIDAQHEKAVQDFETAHFHLSHLDDNEKTRAIAFRATFGEIISCDNLGMEEKADQGLLELHSIMNKLNRCSFSDNGSSEALILCKSKKKSIQLEESSSEKPVDQSPRWCRETVKDTAAAMKIVAGRAKTLRIDLLLQGCIAALEERALKCCDSGAFWETCAGPIYVKWREWFRKEKEGILPNASNYLLYIN